MSKVIYICLNDCKWNSTSKPDFDIISNKIMPDNITALPPKIVYDQGIIFGIFNPSASLLIKGSSICLGSIFGQAHEWWKPLQEYPDGSFALFRGNSRYVEILSDVVASRTVWYFKNDAIFIASTSQRAIILFLKSFQFNEAVIPWVLSAGNLGPEHAWDSRIKRLGGDSSIILDRLYWTLTTKVNEHSFSPSKALDQEHDYLLRRVLKDTFNLIELDYSKWVLPLSGGFDSRGILCLLKEIDALKTITWGLNSSLLKKTNDAYIARSLANFFNLQHEYYEIDISNEPIERIFNRFFICGEGRVDHISGYMDGFEIWRTLFARGVHGIIRGDEAFGWLPVSSPLDVRRGLGISLWSDFPNLRKLEEFGITEQKLPSDFDRKQDESLELWRDRLYHQFRIPIILAALNDLKLSYVEIMNPLLSRRIIHQVRTLPDHLRTDKNLYKRIVRSLGPNIGFAKYQAIETSENILRTRKFIDFFREELNSYYVESIFPSKFIHYIFNNIDNFNKDDRNEARTIKYIIKPYVPAWIRNKARNTFMKLRMDFNVLAFRVYMICRMKKMLAEDADELGPTLSQK
jgi:hypothetical protein